MEGSYGVVIKCRHKETGQVSNLIREISIGRHPILRCCHQEKAKGDWSGEPLISGVALGRDPMELTSSAGTRRLVR